ncbi:MAG TPA: hypothetical protein VF984_06215 [Actinomycetota bacterium]
MTGTRGRFLPTVGIAAGGVVLGHLLAYTITFPVGAVRYRHLAEAGHSSFHRVVIAAALLGGLAAATLCVRSLRTKERASTPTVRLLAGLQVVGFLLLEVIERHGRLGLAFSDPGVRVGLVLQVLVAVALALVLRGFVRVVQAVASLLQRPPRSRPAPILPPAVAFVRPRAGAHLPFARRRAPPLPFPSS